MPLLQKPQEDKQGMARKDYDDEEGVALRGMHAQVSRGVRRRFVYIGQ